MPYSEELAQRIRSAIASRADVEEKKMMGGLAFMINGKMSCGIIGDEIMIRVLPEKYESVLELPNAREMDFTGRVMKGFVYVGAEGLETEKELQKWLALALEFAEKGVVKTKKK